MIHDSGHACRLAGTAEHPRWYRTTRQKGQQREKRERATGYNFERKNRRWKKRDAMQRENRYGRPAGSEVHQWESFSAGAEEQIKTLNIPFIIASRKR